MPSNYWDVITPETVLKFDAPTDGYLCPLSANAFGIEFLRFDVKDYDSGKVVYQSANEPLPNDIDLSDKEHLIRSVRYTFPAEFLAFKTVRTSLEFRIGEQPLNNFRMIELHFFKNQLMRTYDFNFGFCIPMSTNTWEAIYDLPQNSMQKQQEYISAPFAHKSDSFYFVDNKLVMHNKAEYQYVA